MMRLSIPSAKCACPDPDCRCNKTAPWHGQECADCNLGDHVYTGGAEYNDTPRIVRDWDEFRKEKVAADAEQSELVWRE